jgi:hypothetical protein
VHDNDNAHEIPRVNAAREKSTFFIQISCSCAFSAPNDARKYITPYCRTALESRPPRFVVFVRTGLQTRPAFYHALWRARWRMKMDSRFQIPNSQLKTHRQEVPPLPTRNPEQETGKGNRRMLNVECRTAEVCQNFIILHSAVRFLFSEQSLMRLGRTRWRMKIGFAGAHFGE